jgi:hypothetical protein
MAGVSAHVAVRAGVLSRVRVNVEIGDACWFLVSCGVFEDAAASADRVGAVTDVPAGAQELSASLRTLVSAASAVCGHAGRT